jgi:hypothetical protein
LVGLVFIIIGVVRLAGIGRGVEVELATREQAGGLDQFFSLAPLSSR